MNILIRKFVFISDYFLGKKSCKCEITSTNDIHMFKPNTCTGKLLSRKAIQIYNSSTYLLRNLILYIFSCMDENVSNTALIENFLITGVIERTYI